MTWGDLHGIKADRVIVCVCRESSAEVSASYCTHISGLSTANWDIPPKPIKLYYIASYRFVYNIDSRIKSSI
jgi:hypothetical protein